MVEDIRDNLTRVLACMTAAAQRSGRTPATIRLVAVAKTHPPEAVRAAVEAGATIIGENYIQEARAKFETLIHLPAQWHFIGHLQSNKAKYAVRLFQLIHTVDSLGLGAELDRQARKAGKVQEILIQVNISREATKSGVSTAQAIALARDLAQLPNIKVKGLMTMPPYFDAPERARPYFAALRRLRDDIRAQAIPNVDMQELSMGMTGDFEAAIEEGATLVRVGTAIFGGRS
ncbi:MAG: YggS family pyridoxal phosphate-dependent enzyme [Desulfatitalea sp.]|nr:YggS family pyridoxal phosphate-dependent enzyme [Desulfatitalea sp.]